MIDGTFLVRSTLRVALTLLAAPALVVLPARSRAQNGAPALARRQLRIGVVPSGIHLDGRMGDAAWVTADSVELWQVEPREGAAPTGRTVARVLATPDERDGAAARM